MLHVLYSQVLAYSMGEMIQTIVVSSTEVSTCLLLEVTVARLYCCFTDVAESYTVKLTCLDQPLNKL